MQDLKATEARLIDKAKVFECAPLVYEGKIARDAGSPTMQAGDFYFRPQLTTQEVKAPWYLRIFGRKSRIKTDVINTIIISCPFCGLPIGTTSFHRIASRDPLTIENKISCPYSSGADAHAFTITRGTIMTA